MTKNPYINNANICKCKLKYCKSKINIVKCKKINNCSAQVRTPAGLTVRMRFKFEQIPSAKLIFMDLRIAARKVLESYKNQKQK